MNAAQYFPQDYGHPDRNQEEKRDIRPPNEQSLAGHLDSELIEESPVNVLDDAEHRTQGDVGLGLPVDTDPDIT